MARGRTAGNIQIFRHHKFNAPDLHITTGRIIVGRDRHCFHTALMFLAILIDFGKGIAASATRLPGHTFLMVTSI